MNSSIYHLSLKNRKDLPNLLLHLSTFAGGEPWGDYKIKNKPKNLTILSPGSSIKYLSDTIFSFSRNKRVSLEQLLSKLYYIYQYQELFSLAGNPPLKRML